MAKLADIDITIKFTEDGRPQVYKTALLDKAIVIMEKLAKAKIDYSMTYEVKNES